MGRRRVSSAAGAVRGALGAVAVAIALPLSSCPGLAAEPRETLAATVALAEQRYAQALALGHGWSVTEPLLERAQAALARGDVEAAQALAARALLTAEKAIEQAAFEERAWRSRVIEE